MTKSSWISAGLLSLFSTFISSSAQAQDETVDPRGFWLTEDRAVIVATDPCSADAATLCGAIVSIPGANADSDLATAADELCGAPLLWDLKRHQNGKKWIDGKILDVESGVIYGVQISLDDGDLEVRAYDGVPAIGETYRWIRVSAFEPCKSFEEFE